MNESYRPVQQHTTRPDNANIDSKLRGTNNLFVPLMFAIGTFVIDIWNIRNKKHSYWYPKEGKRKLYLLDKLLI